IARTRVAYERGPADAGPLSYCRFDSRLARALELFVALVHPVLGVFADLLDLVLRVLPAVAGLVLGLAPLLLDLALCLLRLAFNAIAVHHSLLSSLVEAKMPVSARAET